MKIIGLFLMVVLAGCSSVPKKMQGTFAGTGADFVVVKRDGAVYWSPLCKTDARLQFVGIAQPGVKHATEVPLILPSASPFLHSKMTYSDDFNSLTFYWGADLKKQVKNQNRSTEYTRNLR